MASWSNPFFRKQFLVSLGLLALILTGLFFVLEFAENRKGWIIEKGWLDAIAKPADYSPFIFAATYSAIAFGLFFCIRKPELALQIIRAYLLLQLMRCICLLCIPLDPPEGIIPLHDPFLQATFYNGRPNLKDLFFSGHIATILLFFYILPEKWMKGIIILLAFCAGILLILQRAHYASDVAAAPLFAFISVWFARRWAASASG